jgi:hypothetical protein
VTNHLASEPLFVLFCYALGQTLLVLAVVYGCAYGLDKLGTAMVRRHRHARIDRTKKPT